MAIKVGIICDLEYSKCFNLKQFYYALSALYGQIKIVKSTSDLEGLELLFIGDDHYPGHAEIFTKPGFIERCNALDIKVIVFSPERLLDSFFPHNVEKYNTIKRFKNLIHYTSDVDDCEKLGTKLHRMLFSKAFKSFIDVDINKKKDAIVFVGNIKNKCYSERKEILNKINNFIPVKIIPTSSISYREYLSILAEYRFVFSPIGNANFFTFRFYEALLVKSIPIHQVRKNTLRYYDIESNYKDCIYFESLKGLPEKIKSFEFQHSHSEFWFEDYLNKILTEDKLL